LALFCLFEMLEVLDKIMISEGQFICGLKEKRREDDLCQLGFSTISKVSLGFTGCRPPSLSMQYAVKIQGFYCESPQFRSLLVQSKRLNAPNRDRLMDHLNLLAIQKRGQSLVIMDGSYIPITLNF